MRRIFLSVVLFIFIGGLPLIGGAQTNPYCDKVKLVQKSLRENHIQPLESESELTERIHDLFYHQLDPSGFFFTQRQIDSFPRLIRPNDIREGYFCPLLDLVKKTFWKNLKWADSLVKARSEQRFDLEKSVQAPSPDDYSESFAEDRRALSQRLLHWYRYSVLQQVVKLQFEDTSATDWREHEQRVREQLQEQFHCYIQEMTDDSMLYVRWVENLFLQAWSGSYDPHSRFYSPRAMRLFQTRLSTKVGSFGMTVDKERFGRVTISEVTPGGPAWKTQHLHEGDQVVAMQPVEGEPLDLNCMSRYEINRWMKSTPAKKLKITILRQGENKESYVLKKDTLQNRENVIKSFVLEGDKKIGYIRIPAFYTEWRTDQPPKGSANDVAKELYKLKQEGIEGLILDLRNNGGGSLYEAGHLAGIFVNRKPLAFSLDTEGESRLMKDPAMGSAYDGPLLIMVNERSASASELVAASLQDLDRAVVVGQSTYGKASSQGIGKLQGEKKSDSITGFLKITRHVLYRLGGDSYQAKGVTPDISLPYLDRSETPSEADKPYVLQAGPLNDKMEHPSILSIPVQNLREKSQERIQSHQGYQKIDSMNQLYNSYRSAGQTTLALSSYQQRYKDYQVTHKQLFSKTFSDSSQALYTVQTHSYDRQVFLMSDFEKQQHQILKNKIFYDIWLRECYRIMNDWIRFTQNK